MCTLNESALITKYKGSEYTEPCGADGARVHDVLCAVNAERRPCAAAETEHAHEVRYQKRERPNHCICSANRSAIPLIGPSQPKTVQIVKIPHS